MNTDAVGHRWSTTQMNTGGTRHIWTHRINKNLIKNNILFNFEWTLVS